MFKFKSVFIKFSNLFLSLHWRQNFIFKRIFSNCKLLISTFDKKIWIGNLSIDERGWVPPAHKYINTGCTLLNIVHFRQRGFNSFKLKKANVETLDIAWEAFYGVFGFLWSLHKLWTYISINSIKMDSYYGQIGVYNFASEMSLQSEKVFTSKNWSRHSNVRFYLTAVNDLWIHRSWIVVSMNFLIIDEVPILHPRQNKRFN